MLKPDPNIQEAELGGRTTLQRHVKTESGPGFESLTGAFTSSLEFCGDHLNILESSREKYAKKCTKLWGGVAGCVKIAHKFTQYV